LTSTIGFNRNWIEHPWTMASNHVLLLERIAGSRKVAVRFSDVAACNLYHAETTLEGAVLLESAVTMASPDRGMKCVKRFRDLASGEEVEVIDSIDSREDGIRWKISVKGQGHGKGISLPICTVVHLPNPEQLKYWAAWAVAPGDALKQREKVQNPLANMFRSVAGKLLLDRSDAEAGNDEGIDAEELQELKEFAKEGLNWSDPLVLVPFSSRVYWYGAPPWEQANQHVNFCPFDPDVISIPAMCVIDEAARTGFSIVLDPGDLILDMTVEVTADGRITFKRLHHKITANDANEFSLDLVFHEPGWRASMAWMVERYPSFFDPPVPSARDIAGCGA
jgi:hypothetical protein